MRENHILILYSRTIFNNLANNNKINFRKLEANRKKIMSIYILRYLLET